VPQDEVSSQMVDLEFHHLAISLSLLSALKLSDALNVLFVNELNAGHKAGRSRVN